ncbi:LPS assembly lipoprotein LptE [Thalassovita taeanensis]|uniref:LPS-assembly lipoprotein n=1 Tax=Thalassovita taeanensis TaxID=657014 RepID=A0A1H9CHA5_9RHOB|nr:LPS assembly lipoprotein LptE [Thalassovita taeanensis]SEQ00397.1 LPS-assembly lipoprotein [Thalassovita taeanensis]
MWLSDRRNTLLALVALAALTACGFAPAYGPSGQADKLLGAILVDAPETRDDQLLVRQIETRLGRADLPRYALGYDLKVVEERMAVSATNITTRFNLVGSVRYALRDTDTGDILTTGTVSHFTGYSTTGTTVATLAAERDAHERLSSILADQIVARLIAASPDLPE